MGSITAWDPYLDTPTVLDDLLSEVEINNSFSREALQDQLIDTMESSYSYLYRFQEESVVFQKFHYQTREYLLNTTYNDIQKGLKLYGDQLKELESEENPNIDKITELKRTLADFGEVRFGDLYLDDKRRVCVNIPYDVVYHKARELFRQSNLYRNDLSIDVMMKNALWFKAIPVAFMDNVVKSTILVYPLEQGTKIIFSDMKATDLYNREESQIFHDVCIIMTTPVVNTKFTSVDVNSVKSGIISSINLSTIKNQVIDKTGLFMAYVEVENNSSHLIDAEINGNNLVLHPDDAFIKLLTTSTVTLGLIYFQNMHLYKYGSFDGTVPSNIKIWQTDDTYDEVVQSEIFIPNINGKNTAMPIPEKNFFVLVSDYGTSTSVQSYIPYFKGNIKMYYPNMYQIDGDAMSVQNRYKVYFFYQDEADVRYTPLFDFYWDYLYNHFGSVNSMEEIVNLIYFKKPGYARNDFAKVVMEPAFVTSFLTLFDKILEYKDQRYTYGTPDFMKIYTQSDIPLHYKISRLKEFIRSDWTSLTDYVKKQRKLETIYHFFVNTINLKGRFRRSTRLESKESDMQLFASSCIRCNASDTGALEVTSSTSYDSKYEIYIEDVKIIIPDITEGEFVKLSGTSERYVFAFKNAMPTKSTGFKIFVDGLLCSDVVTIHSLGMDYVYLPANMVTENSYIMMEKEYGIPEPQITIMTFNSNREWKSLHLIENDSVRYTMNDITLKINGEALTDEMYTINLVRNGVVYDMEDERHETVNKYGIVVDVQIKLNIEVSSGTEVEVILNKASFISAGRADRNGYPRFHLNELKATPDIRFARMYSNGRLVPRNSYRLVNSEGRIYIQSRIFYSEGDQYHFELSPYRKDLVCEFTEFDPDKPLDLSKYIDKPLDPAYYEVYVNGRRLGLPNVFPFGPYYGLFRGVKSKYLLEIYEKERDFEYFGYSQITKTYDGEKYEFFYLPTDLLTENFMTDGEAELIMDAYINAIKNENVVIEPNSPTEDPVSYTIESGLIEEMKIFFFEELLPLTLGNPDKVQFNKAYISEVFPNFTEEFMVESLDENSPDVIFLNPDISARIKDIESGEYEIIDTSDADLEKRYVMLTGEAE